MEPIRRDIRLTVDLREGTVSPDAVDIVQLAPGSPPFFRDSAGAYHPVSTAGLYSGDRYVISRVYPHLADAKREVAAELHRRGERLLALASRCHQLEEVSNG